MGHQIYNLLSKDLGKKIFVLHFQIFCKFDIVSKKTKSKSEAR